MSYVDQLPSPPSCSSWITWEEICPSSSSQSQGLSTYFSSTLYRKSDLSIPRNETVRSRSQYLNHVSVSDLYIPRYMNVETGRQKITVWICFRNNKAAQFHFWKYIKKNHTFKLDSHRPFICSASLKVNSDPDVWLKQRGLNSKRDSCCFRPLCFKSYIIALIPKAHQMSLKWESFADKRLKLN